MTEGEESNQQQQQQQQQWQEVFIYNLIIIEYY
jgi:hypothetical protein